MPSLAQAPDAEGHNAAGAPPKLSNSLQLLQPVESHIPTQAKTADQEAEAEGFEQLRVLLDDLIPNDCMDLLETPNISSQMTGPNLKKILPTDWLTSKLAANAAYSKQPKDRPNTTYTVLISLAMYSSGTGKATVKAIYEFIADQFPYYSYKCVHNWKSSVRHCLSQNKAFVKLTTPGGSVAQKRCWWTIAPDMKDDIDKDIVRFLDQEPFDMRHIEPLSKFYAEIEFYKAQQEGIPLQQAAQPAEYPVEVLLTGCIGPCGAYSAVDAVIPPPMIQNGHPTGGHGYSHNVAYDFQDLLGDIMDSTLGNEAGEREGHAFDEDLAKYLLAVDPELVPSAAVQEGATSSKEGDLILLNSLEVQDLLKEMEEPAM